MGRKNLKWKILCAEWLKNSLEPSSKLMYKSGIQGKIEAYEHLGDINAKKLEFDVSGPSGPKTVGARGGIRTPNRRRPKFTPQKIRWRITGDQKEKTDGDQWLCLNFYPCKWCEKLAGGL